MYRENESAALNLQFEEAFELHIRKRSKYYEQYFLKQKQCRRPGHTNDIKISSNVLRNFLVQHQGLLSTHIIIRRRDRLLKQDHPLKLGFAFSNSSDNIRNPFVMRNIRNRRLLALILQLDFQQTKCRYWPGSTRLSLK